MVQDIWVEGTDYSKTEVLVAFEDGTTSSYAESILANHPIDIIAQVSEDPLLYLIEDPSGRHSIDLSADLREAEDRITFAIPSTE